MARGVKRRSRLALATTDSEDNAIAHRRDHRAQRDAERRVENPGGDRDAQAVIDEREKPGSA